MTSQTDPRVDAYIEQAAEFAQPILRHLRKLIFTANPEIKETIKWGAPGYEFKGIVAIMAAMTNHAVLNLWKGELIPEVQSLYGERSSEAMGTIGKIKHVDDLPSDDKVIGWIREAIDLNVRGVKLPQRSKSGQKPESVTPDDLANALSSNSAARDHFEGFTPGKRREYIDWLEEAKTATTRQKRLEQATEWIAEGKSRHWKYQKS